MDASTSYDPDVKLFTSSGLNFNWSCVVNCLGVILLKNNAAKVEINGTSLKPGKSFQVSVSVSASLGRRAEEKQIIRVVGDDVPTTEIV